jgi:hypothetical protein
VTAASGAATRESAGRTPATVVVGLAWAGAAFAAPLTGIRPWRSVPVSDFFVALAIIGMVLAPSCRRRQFPVHITTGLGLLAAGSLLGAAFARQPAASAASTAAFLFTAGGPPLAMGMWRPTRQELRRFFLLLLAGAVGNALYALAVSPTVAGRRLGLSSHPNSLGLVCLLGIAIAAGVTLSGRRAARLVGPVSAAILGAGLVVSGSRAALLGVAAALLAVIWFSSRWTMALAPVGARLAALVGVAVLVGIATAPVHHGLVRLAGDPSTAESDAERIEQLVGSLHRVESAPLTGVGLHEAQAAHDIYLQAFVAAGPLGLLGLALVIRGILDAARQGMAHAGLRPQDATLLAGLTAGYIGYLVAGAFQNSLSDRTVWVFVAGMLVLSRALIEHGESWEVAGR